VRCHYSSLLFIEIIRRSIHELFQAKMSENTHE
jgi:hypothetical protein